MKLLNKNDARNDDESLEEEEGKDTDADFDRTRDSDDFRGSTSNNASTSLKANNSGSSESKSDSPSTKADVKNAALVTPVKNNNAQEASGRGGDSDEKRAYIASSSSSATAATTTVSGTPGASASSAGAASMSSPSSAAVGGLEPLRGGGRQALPHHIPKLEGLGRKIDDIRKTMGEDVSVHYSLFMGGRINAYIFRECELLGIRRESLWVRLEVIMSPESKPNEGECVMRFMCLMNIEETVVI